MIGFEEAHKRFVEHLSEKDRADSTIIAYKKDIQQLLNHINETEDKSHVHHINTDDIKSFLSNLEQQNYTKKSISRKLNSIKTFFRFLKMNDLVVEDPSTVISHPKFETPAPRILTKTEYRALRDAAREDVRTFAIIELLLQTGIRIGELAQIMLDDLTIEEENEAGTLKIPESRTTLERSIPLNKAAVSALSDYIKERPDTEDTHLFVTRTGNPLLVRNIRASIDRFYERAGIENAKVNDLRHTWIAHHIKEGTSLITISKLAGHRRLATTEKYLEYVEVNNSSGVDLEEL
ncbi:tyrosine-type recombinase/integrase [candidate division WWE3 bacterium]|uniref:Tyrosine-type recombinase/integrase n=1 Tax=candidate division WWE3 bacterium TaxID=2053526 RepID=A0A955LK97_UNCKA|nr:tyrosine-type recombinase/integrase [candidate division WWE3 bacterium]